MFPYAMLATTTIFYANDWPKRFLLKLRLIKKEYYDEESKRFCDISKLSNHCLYEKVKSSKAAGVVQKASVYHQFFTIFAILYISEQSFLPYSHFITKGYNNWTNGLYGYSWDMMVHSWHTQHIKIHFVDKETGEVHYLSPNAWTRRRRWSSHADMIHQYAKCIQQKLVEHNYTNVELYMDIWRSMNHRFNQRQIDPRVDLLQAEWSPWEETAWLMPLMTNLNDWRTKMSQIEAKYRKMNEFVDLTFVADVSGLKLENFVTQHLNATVEVLNGQINLEVVEENKNYTLNVGDKMQVNLKPSSQLLFCV
jgi:vitamin K-dependent gamma-carboxylase